MTRSDANTRAEMDSDPAELPGFNSPYSPAERMRAFNVYYATKSLRNVPKACGVPVRTFRSWLTHPKLEQERQVVKDALARQMQDRASSLAYETEQTYREAMKATQRALGRLAVKGGSKDGGAEARLLTAATRAHEVLDRIARLDEGQATEIHGLTLAPEDVQALQRWHRERQERLALSPEELIAAEDEEIRAILESLPPERLERVLPPASRVIEGEVLEP